MQSKRDPMTQFGLDVSMFCLRVGITKKQLAKEANIPYDTLLQVCKGRRAGHEAKKAVRQIMLRYEEELED